MNNNGIILDPLFKGCTRPAMVFDIPLVPFACVFGVTVLLSVYISLALLLALPVIILLMRMVTKHDDQQFRLLWLKTIFQYSYQFKNRRFWKSSAYSPLDFKKRK